MRWVVNATPWPRYPREGPGIHRIGGWVGPRAGLDGCGKSCPPTGIRSSDRPACRESLYRLSSSRPLCGLCYVEFPYVLNSDTNPSLPWSIVIFGYVVILATRPCSPYGVFRNHFMGNLPIERFLNTPLRYSKQRRPT